MHVGKSAHEEGREGGNGSSAGDEVAADLGFAEKVGVVGLADGIIGGRVLADAGAATGGDNGRIDGKNIGHGEECDDAGAELGQEVGALALAGLRRRRGMVSTWMSLKPNDQVHAIGRVATLNRGAMRPPAVTPEVHCVADGANGYVVVDLHDRSPRA